MEAARQAAKELPDAAKAWSFDGTPDDLVEDEIARVAAELMATDRTMKFTTAVRRVLETDKRLAVAYAANEPYRAPTGPRQATAADIRELRQSHPIALGGGWTARRVERLDVPCKVAFGPALPLAIEQTGARAGA